jgi:hypothetical protein
MITSKLMIGIFASTIVLSFAPGCVGGEEEDLASMDDDTVAEEASAQNKYPRPATVLGRGATKSDASTNATILIIEECRKLYGSTYTYPESRKWKDQSEYTHMGVYWKVQLKANCGRLR